MKDVKLLVLGVLILLTITMGSSGLSFWYINTGGIENYFLMLGGVIGIIACCWWVERKV